METCTIEVPPPPAIDIKVIDASELGNAPSPTMMDENTMLSEQNDTITADKSGESPDQGNPGNNAGDCKQCSLLLKV